MTSSEPVGLVVLARMDSRRLPGKALLPIGGRPLLGRVLDRVKTAPGISTLVVATSERPVDDVLAAFAAGEGWAVHRGPAEDVLARMAGCAAAFGLVHAIRICGDSPFADPGLIADMLAIHLDERPDLTTNVFPRSFPPGLSVEIMTAGLLARLDGTTTSPADREHVTKACYDRPGSFVIRNVAAIRELPRTHLAIDQPRDMDRAEAICRQLALAPSMSIDEIVAAGARWDHLHPPESKS
jgi:spore coat polysaccharide biosynthesis protein SpsF